MAQREKEKEIKFFFVSVSVPAPDCRQASCRQTGVKYFKINKSETLPKKCYKR